MARTLFDKVWDLHVVQRLPDGWALLHVDRHLLHDLSGTAGLNDLAERGLTVRNPELAFATPDHAVSTAPHRTGETFPGGARLYKGLQLLSGRAGIRLFDLGQPGHGIVHVMGPELGIVLPGMTVVCGDSHTCTNGALGAIAFGIGSSELTHALATQTLLQRKPKTFCVRFQGELGRGVAAKDMALHAIAQLGAASGTGYAIEFAGTAVQALGVEERMTLCNMAIEMGAKIGMVAPDDTTLDYMRGRPFAPQGALFDQACVHWRQLASDSDAAYDLEVTIDATSIEPMVTWGTSPEQAIAVSAKIPREVEEGTGRHGGAESVALNYMALRAGEAIAGTPIDRVFIGSCTNSRLSDLRAAAAVVRGKQVDPRVTAWVVPGSQNVKLAAEAEGLNDIFVAAGFEWREPGCSMCVAANGEQAAPGERVVSTSNRNFVGRQGPGVRTHLASPASAAAAAIAGAIVDIRSV